MEHTLPAIDVFAMAIEYLVNDMHDGIKERMSGVIKKSEVHWVNYVITFPAIWTDSAKQFMRKAGEQVCYVYFIDLFHSKVNCKVSNFDKNIKGSAVNNFTNLQCLFRLESMIANKVLP
jgi:hypothetical protein